ncbi:MAG TPA: hypothetical protein VE957_14620 [Terriglobales bacterium]|nr:hypothetical protein [Terriglobales bacterium]
MKPASKTVAQKTNAARLLDQMGIHYELKEYDVDPDDLGPRKRLRPRSGCRRSRFSKRWSRVATVTELPWR